MRRLIVVLAAIGLLTAPAALARGTLPEKIALPNAFAPEGIEIAHGDTFFVGSDPDRGDLLRQPAHRRRAGHHPRRRSRHARGDRVSSTTAASCGSRGRPAARLASTT